MQERLVFKIDIVGSYEIYPICVKAQCLHALKPLRYLSFHTIRGNGNHEKWCNVVKGKEFVDLEKPLKRMSTFEFQ